MALGIEHLLQMKRTLQSAWGGSECKASQRASFRRFASHD